MKATALKVSRVFLMEWNRVVQYRADAFLWMVAEAIIPLVSLTIWFTVAKSSTNVPTPQDILTYYVLVILIKLATDAWGGVFLAQEILNGEIIKSLIRPLAVVWYNIANNLFEKILKAIIPVPIIIFILVRWSDHFSPAIYQPTRIALFVLSLSLAMILSFTIDFILGMIAFWIEDNFQLRRYRYLLESFTSGLLIPLVFMPTALVGIIGFLPFRFIISAPAEIITGQTILINTVAILAIQAAWVVITILAAIFIWHKGLQRYAPPGQ